MHLLSCNGQSLRCSPGWDNPGRCVLVQCGWGVQEGTMLPAQLLTGFQSLPLLLTSKLGPSGADSWVSGFVYVLGPCGSLQWPLLWGWEFFLPLQPPKVFSIRGFEALFPCTGTLGCTVCLAPQFFLPVNRHTNVGPSVLPAAALPCPLCPSCPSPPLLLVWMNVSSLTPCLSDFYIVQFSGHSHFLFLNLLLSFFCLCKGARYPDMPRWKVQSQVRSWTTNN